MSFISFNSSFFTKDSWCNLNDHRAYRYICILEGINQIFNNVVQAKTEEELGNTCLSVALELTGSQYGFIGEVREDGLLHDIAISEMGWEKCQLYDKTGHRRPPRSFFLRGLYDFVIDYKKSFFTNNPESNPYSIGVPSGHPSILSFLGVPLIEDEKTVGIIAVANRESGYNLEQLEDLEAIAPSVIQAINRNKAEKALLDANKQIKTQSDELIIQSYELQAQNEELTALFEEVLVQNEELIAQSETLNKAEEALHKSEERFNLAFKAAQEGVWDWNMETNEVWYSSRYEEILGYSEGEIENHVSSWLRLLHPDDKERALKLVAGLMIGERKYEAEFRLRHKDGHYLDILSRSYPIIRESDGKIVRIVGTHLDITERKRMEEAEELRRAVCEGDLDALVIPRPEGDLIFTVDGADRAYRVLVETMNEGTATLNSDCIILYCNSIFAEYLRTPINDIIGTSIYKFIANVDSTIFKALLDNKKGKEEIKLRAKGDIALPVILSVNSMQDNESPNKWCIVITDLTEHKKSEQRKRALETIQRSENQLWDIVKNIKSGVALVDETGRFTVVNPSFMQIFGLDNEFDILNVNSQDWSRWEVYNEDSKLLHVNDHPVLKAVITGKPVKDQLVAVRNPGASEIIWLQVSAEPILGEDDKIFRVICTYHNITERKKAEEALRESEERLQVIIAHSPDIIFEQDHDLRYTWVFNPTPPLSVSEILGKTDKELMSPDQAQLLTSIKRRVLETGTRENAVLLLTHGSETRWFEVIYEPRFDAAGNVIGILSYTRDVTERKQAEEELVGAHSQIQSIIDNTPDIIYAFDQEERFLLVNSSVANVLNSTPDRMIGKRRHEFMPKMDADWHEANDRQVFEAGKVIEFEEYSHLDGRSITWLTKKFPLRDAQGRIYAVAGISADITERKKAEDALRKSESDLKKSQEIARVGSWEWDLEGSLFTGSDELYHIFGLTPNPNTLFKQFIDRIDPKDKQRVLDALDETIKRNVPYNIDYQIVSHNGNNRFIHAEAVTIFNDGRPAKIIGTVQDITERKKTEEALRESEERFRLALQNSPVNVSNQDLNLRYIWQYNPQLDYEVKDVIGKIDSELLTPETAEHVTFLKRKVIENNQKIREEIATQYKGNTFTYDFTVEPLHNSLGDVIGVANVVIDITERKKAEEALKKQAALIDLSPDGIISRQLDGTINFWSKGAQSLYGWTNQEATGQKIHTLLRTRFSQPLEQINKQIQQTGHWSGELIHCTKDDRQIIVQSRWQLVFNDLDNMKGILESNVNITELKEAEEALKIANDTLEQKIKERTAELEAANSSLIDSEEKYRNIVETSNEGIIVCDSNFKATYVNNKMADMLGYRQEELIGKTALDFSDGEGKIAVMLNRDIINWLATTEVFEFKFIRKDGSFLWTLVNSKLNFDMEGNFTGSLNMFTDITERKQALEIREKYELSRKKEIHHRIKNNLQVISSLLDLQSDKFKSKKMIEGSEVLQAFRESQDRVLSMALIHEELHDSGTTDFIDLLKYIEELSDNLFLTYRLGNTNTKIIKDIREGIFFNMDIAVPLGLIVNELISNSLKYAFIDRDNGEIRIKLHREDTVESNSSIYVLSVADNGVGIPKDLEIEDLDSLGLQLVTTLVDQLDGEFELNRDNGTEFIIRFTVEENNSQTTFTVPHLLDND